MENMSKIEVLKELLSQFDYTKSIIFAVDSYKFSHPFQYPPEMEYAAAYLEPRKQHKSINSKLTVAGTWTWVNAYLLNPVTQNEIDAAEIFAELHGVPFYKEGWQYILDAHGGFLPLAVYAIPEGTRITPSNAIVTVYNTDPKCGWLVGHVETSLQRDVWYMSSVASVSRAMIDIVDEYLKETSDLPTEIYDAVLRSRVHDFGARGTHAAQAAAHGGHAHIMNSNGSDTIEGILHSLMVYDAKDMPAFSIPAAEHSTITSWGSENELSVYRHLASQFSNKFAYYAIVLDSYNLEDALDLFGSDEKLNSLVKNGTGTFVARPDSGNPVEIVPLVLNKLANIFGYTVNSKGYKVLPSCVKMIQGDGISLNSLGAILEAIKIEGFSVENVAFGSGGKLLAGHMRDDWSFAYKLSYIANSDLTIERAVKKNPKTDPSKASKGGILEVFKHGDEYVTKAYSTAFDPEVVAARTQSELKNIYYHSLEKRNISYPDFDQIVDRARA